MKKFLIVILAIFAMAPDCTPPAPPSPPPVPTPVDPPDSDKCPAACANLTKLHCAAGDPFKMPDGSVVTCEQFCRETQKQGVYLNPDCVSKVTSCAEAETKCAVGKPR